MTISAVFWASTIPLKIYQRLLMLYIARFGFPIDYLGVSLDGNPSKKDFWNPVIEICQKKLTIWKAK